MNRIDEDKLNELHKTMREVVGEDCVIVTLKNWNHDVDEHKRLLSKLEIAEKNLEKMVSGDVWMLWDDNPVDAYKELAKHALQQIRS